MKLVPHEGRIHQRSARHRGWFDGYRHFFVLGRIINNQRQRFDKRSEIGDLPLVVLHLLGQHFDTAFERRAAAGRLRLTTGGVVGGQHGNQYAYRTPPDQS